MNKGVKSHKVLHMTTVPDFLPFLEKQLAFFKQNGFDVHILSSPGKQLDDFARAEEITKHEVHMEREISVVKDIRSLWKVWLLLRKHRFDIIHAHTPKAGLLGMVAAAFARVDVRIYHLHGLTFPTRTGIKKRILYLAEKLSCCLSTRTYAVSESLKAFVIDQKIISSDKIRLIQNGSINGLDWRNQFNRSSYETSKMANSFGITESDFVIGFVGRVVKDKGVVELIEAYKQLHEHHIQVKLLIVGDIYKHHGLPKETVEEIQFNDEIIYVGAVDNAAPFYNLMDVLVFPTYGEGFGLVAIEAMAMGIPVVASQVLGCVDTVEDGKSGFLVPVRNVGSIVEKVEYYIQNHTERLTHGEYGRRVVSSKYDQQLIWNELVDDYRVFVGDL